MKENKRVTGSVIQRSIVPEDITAILNVASIPSEDIGYKKSLKFVVTQLFGVSLADCLTNLDYDRSLRIISEPDFWDRLREFYYESYGPSFGIFSHKWYQYFRRWSERYFEDLKESSLSDDIIVCQLASINIANILPPFNTVPVSIPLLTS